ncbi:MAG TPA: universal stress protein [Baekduia sp.]|nr:universal stress protein [Baekduia sp.]
MLGRGLGSPALFTIVYTSVASAIYFSLGVVAGNALGLTPFVYFAAGIFFVLAAMTYVEGSSLHQERGGSTVFARYAFNELISFIAGWAILLDYVILVAVTALSATHYAARFYAPLGRGEAELFLAIGIVLYVALRNIRGFSTTRLNRVAVLVVADVALQGVLIVLGLIYFFDADVLTQSIDFGTTPGWSDTIFALGVATVVFTGLESASGLAGEVEVRAAGLRRLITSVTVSVMAVYTGIAVVALTAQPVTGGRTELSHRYLEAPVLGITAAFDTQWLADGLSYFVAIAATMTLVAAANSAMLGLSRLAYSLSRNRQIPVSLGRLHPSRATPFVLICLAALIAIALLIPEDIELLVGIFAFGSLLALTIAHTSLVVLRVKEPDARRPYRMPGSLPWRGAQLPLPAVVGAVLALLAWISVMIFHEGARYVGFGWMAFGLALYVVYRMIEGKSLTKRIIVDEQALRGERIELEYGSILVPLTGTAIDDDIIQTAGRLAGEGVDFDEDDDGSTIEAVYVIEVPMALPIDARLPDDRIEGARTALRRAKAVGEEYFGVEVATASVRARRSGAAIVEEARRRGVQAIVMGAEEPSRIRGGSLLGGRGGPLDNFVGETTKYVLAHAHCPVILTVPPTDDVTISAARDSDSQRPSGQ